MTGQRLELVVGSRMSALVCTGIEVNWSSWGNKLGGVSRVRRHSGLRDKREYAGERAVCAQEPRVRCDVLSLGARYPSYGFLLAVLSARVEDSEGYCGNVRWRRIVARVLEFAGWDLDVYRAHFVRSCVRRKGRCRVDILEPRHVRERRRIHALEWQRGRYGGAERLEDSCERQLGCIGVDEVCLWVYA
jgi:hypothetical protein